MKKLILPLAAVALFLASCSGNETKTDGTTTEGTTAGTEQTPSDQPAAAPADDAPTFSSDEVNKGLADYKALLNDYKAALASKDQTKISEFTTKFTQWSQNASSWATKLKPEEAQKFSDYMQKLTSEWTAAAQEAVK